MDKRAINNTKKTIDQMSADELAVFLTEIFDEDEIKRIKIPPMDPERQKSFEDLLETVRLGQELAKESKIRFTELAVV